MHAQPWPQKQLHLEPYRSQGWQEGQFHGASESQKVGTVTHLVEMAENCHSAVEVGIRLPGRAKLLSIRQQQQN